MALTFSRCVTQDKQFVRVVVEDFETDITLQYFRHAVLQVFRHAELQVFRHAELQAFNVSFTIEKPSVVKFWSFEVTSVVDCMRVTFMESCIVLQSATN